MAQPEPWERELARRNWQRSLTTVRLTDRELAAILRDAAGEADRILAAMPDGGVGIAVRRAQYQLAANSLREISQDLWHSVSVVVRRGIVRSAADAAQGQITLLNVLGRSGAPRSLLDSLVASTRFTAQHVQSRYINNIDLSPTVWRNQHLTNGRLDRTINQGLALGKSAREIAKDVSGMIRPDVRGGVSYAAMRLGRTELNNAFHATSVRMAQEQPWVEGMKWELSGSHPVPDICNEMAEQDHSGLGTGVYPIGEVPPKPHPNCLCYTTTITPGREEFINRLIAGDYDGHMSGTLA